MINRFKLRRMRVARALLQALVPVFLIAGPLLSCPGRSGIGLVNFQDKVGP